MTRNPVAITRFAVSGFMFRFTVLRSVANVLPLSSVAIPMTSMSFLNIPSASANGSVLPLMKVEITTEPLGAGPLNTAAVSASGNAVSGNGLSMASFSSIDVPSLDAALASGAFKGTV